MRITVSQYSAACRVASKVFDGGMKAQQGIALLSSKHGLNKATASDFINDYKYLLRGQVFQRAMSAPAMRHFMEQIFSERGQQHKQNAIEALHAHIEYYEKHYKTVLHSMRKVADEFDALMRGPDNFEELEAEFVAAVKRSMRTTRKDRLRRLAEADKQPRSLKVEITVFARNPDVVAEVLLRAGGKCEACKANAPFVRASDGTPYLEVHHRIKLSKGGDDTVENAIALCPNCHRRAHYGSSEA